MFFFFFCFMSFIIFTPPVWLSSGHWATVHTWHRICDIHSEQCCRLIEIEMTLQELQHQDKENACSHFLILATASSTASVERRLCEHSRSQQRCALFHDSGKLQNEEGRRLNICTIIFPVNFADKVGYLFLSVNNSNLCGTGVQVGNVKLHILVLINHIIFGYHEGLNKKLCCHTLQVIISDKY